MQKGIIELINNKIIHYPYPKSIIGEAAHCPYFEINVSEVKLISISPRMMLDDEALFISFVNNKGVLFNTTGYNFSSNGLDKIEKRFGLPSINDISNKFEHADHYGKIDKIIYPKHLFWKDLYKKDWKWRLRNFYSGFGVSKSLFGNFTDEVKPELLR